MELKKIINISLDLLFPVQCLGCQLFMSGESPTPHLCQTCLKKIKLISHDYCAFCSTLSHEGKTCPTCRPTHYLDYSWAAAAYSQPLVRKMLWAYKYKFVSSLHFALGALLIKFLRKQEKDLFFTTDREQLVVIPVPLHPRRWRWRSYNQSGLLATDIAHAFDLPLDTKNLLRHKHRRPQTELEPEAREANASGIFSCAPSSIFRDKTVILVDDVCTTGSTLDSCAQVLKAAGARQVIGLVVAKG